MAAPINIITAKAEPKRPQPMQPAFFFGLGPETLKLTPCDLPHRHQREA